MPLEPKKSRVALFFAIGFGLSLLLALLKALIAWATHTYLYSVPWIGGFLKSIEITEISNLLIFAILGVGIGATTFLLPRKWDHRAKLAFLFFVSPFVFCASYMMQQHLWIKQVATQSNISYRDAQELTNDYLEREVGSRGFFGFYPFSTQLAELPTRKDSLSAQESLNPNELLAKELASYNDPRADLAAYWFKRIGWLIRFMYMTIAGLTGLIYYFKGYAWAENRPQVNTLGTDATASKKVSKRSSATDSSPVRPPSIKPPKGQSPPTQPRSSSRPNPSGPQAPSKSVAAYPNLYSENPSAAPSSRNGNAAKNNSDNVAKNPDSPKSPPPAFDPTKPSGRKDQPSIQPPTSEDP